MSSQWMIWLHLRLDFLSVSIWISSISPILYLLYPFLFLCLPSSHSLFPPLSFFAEMSNGASPAQTQQLLEKFDTRLAAAHEKLRKFNETDKAYEELEGLLHSLPLKTSHKVKVPLSRKGFYIGDLTRTNELMILLGDNWFADCSASESLQVVSRRRSGR